MSMHEFCLLKGSREAKGLRYVVSDWFECTNPYVELSSYSAKKILVVKRISIFTEESGSQHKTL